MTCWRRADAHHRSSVFISFICSRLVFIHPDTSSTQADILFVRSSTWGDSQNPLIWVSSAYPCGTRLWRFISCRRSAVYRKNKIGPRTELWGTQYSSWKPEMAWNWTWLIGPLVHNLSGTIQTSPVLLLSDRTTSSASAGACRGRHCRMQPTGWEVSASLSCPSLESAVCHLGLWAKQSSSSGAPDTPTEDQEVDHCPWDTALSWCERSLRYR